MSYCSDVMKPVEAVSCCTPKDTALHAARAMRASGCGCAPVVENRDSLKVVGVATEREVRCGVGADDRKPSDVPVEDIMRPASACCGTDDPIEEARRKLNEHQARGLPVVNKAGGCCGTISTHSMDKGPG